ncbi:hypothetical protein ABIF21_000053 [Bradyrhizobium elkanii]
MPIPQIYGCELSDKVAAAPMQPEQIRGAAAQPVASAPRLTRKTGKRSIAGRSGEKPYDRVPLKLLEFSPFERHPRGGWRFGAKTISTAVADRLIASGRAEIVDGLLRSKLPRGSWPKLLRHGPELAMSERIERYRHNTRAIRASGCSVPSALINSLDRRKIRKWFEDSEQTSARLRDLIRTLAKLPADTTIPVQLP